MSRMTEVFGGFLQDASQNEIDYIESYVFLGKTPNEWVIESDNHPEQLSDDPIYYGEPVSHSIMNMARTAVILAREAYKNL